MCGFFVTTFQASVSFHPGMTHQKEEKKETYTKDFPSTSTKKYALTKNFFHFTLMKRDFLHTIDSRAFCRMSTVFWMDNVISIINCWGFSFFPHEDDFFLG